MISPVLLILPLGGMLLAALGAMRADTLGLWLLPLYLLCFAGVGTGMVLILISAGVLKALGKILGV